MKVLWKHTLQDQDNTEPTEMSAMQEAIVSEKKKLLSMSSK